MPISMEELAKLYMKVKDGSASTYEKADFDIEVAIRCWPEDMIIAKLEEMIKSN